MNWSSSTLRAAAEIQAQIERLDQALTALLHSEGIPVLAFNGRDDRSATAPTTPEPEGESGGSVGPTMTGSKGPNGDGAPLSPSEWLDELLFWGSEFTPSKVKKARRAPTYHVQGLKRDDSGGLLMDWEVV